MFKIVNRYDPKPWIAHDTKPVDILVTGDWHALDKFGINPPHTASKEGTPVAQSKLQKKVFKETREICKGIGHVDVVLLMGDLAEGKQMKAFGIPLNDADTDVQVDSAFRFYEETVFKYCTPDYVIVVMGTPYHVTMGIGGNLDYQIAEKISRISKTIFGYPSLTFFLGRDKVRWHAQHRMSFARVNRMMPLEKTVRQWATMEANSLTGNEQNIPDVIVRAHRHEAQIPIGIGEGRRWAMVSPPLKAVDVYADLMPYPVRSSVALMKVTQMERNFYPGKLYPIDTENKKVEIV